MCFSTWDETSILFNNAEDMDMHNNNNNMVLYNYRIYEEYRRTCEWLICAIRV